ncbi:MAG: prepilin-type N-terminal cleavage/methylation domain-containing protein [Bacillota bacterium]
MRPRKQHGFTLLEVVVAFVVLALILGTVFQIFSAGLARAADMDEYSGALDVAQSRLASFSVDEPLNEGETTGESADHRYQWKVSVQRTQQLKESGEAIQGTFDLYRVEVAVGWKSGDGKQRQFNLATLMLGQKAS